MNPKFLLSLSILSAGLVLSQAPLRADDAQTPPPQPPPADNPPSADVPPADGQTPPPAHRRMHRPLTLAELTAKLSLTADQQKLIGPILDSAKSQAKELHDDDSISQDDKRAKMKEILSASRAQIRADLTPEQQKIFDTMGEHGGRGGPSAAPSPTPTPPTT